MGMKKPVLKAYYGGIFFEFVLHERMADVVIILPDFPGRGEYREIMGVFYDKGYHVFVPRYRGTYQSKGSFLSKNPVDDLIFFVQHMKLGKSRSLWDKSWRTFKINKILVVASGFAGALACGFAAKSGMISHVILASPIWDYAKHNERGDEQDLDIMTSFVQRAYQNCYRFNFTDIIKKLNKFEELNPAFYLPKLQKLPLLVFHDPNDKLVAFWRTKEMIARLPRATLLEHYLGHGLPEELLRSYWKELDKFVKVNYLG